jgi:cell division protein FtsQ
VSLSTSLPDRVAERGRARRRSRWRGVLVVLVLLVVVAGAGWLVLGSSALGVAHVRVTGLDRLTPAEVQEAAAIEPGTPLARLDTDAVAERLAALAPVRAVEVARRWPRTVEVSVRERTAAAVQARGSSWVLVDRGGVAFGTESRRPRGLPLVSAPVDAGAPALRAALDVLDALPADVRAKVREVRAATREHVTLRLSKDRTVVWGSTERSDRKAAVLAVLLSRRASVYDVSAPDTPTTRR